MVARTIRMPGEHGHAEIIVAGTAPLTRSRTA
jgi:hypothetical protein